MGEGQRRHFTREDTRGAIGHGKGRSPSPAIGKMQIRCRARCHLTPAGMAVIKKTRHSRALARVWRRGPSGTAGEDVSRCGHCGKRRGGSSKIKRRRPYDPAAPPGVHPKDAEPSSRRGGRYSALKEAVRHLSHRGERGGC